MALSQCIKLKSNEKLLSIYQKIHWVTALPCSWVFSSIRIRNSTFRKWTCFGTSQKEKGWSYGRLRVRLVHVFENWKLLFENICGNTCGWKSVWEYVKYCLKTKNCCLKIQTKHPLICYCFANSPIQELFYWVLVWSPIEVKVMPF